MESVWICLDSTVEEQNKKGKSKAAFCEMGKIRPFAKLLGELNERMPEHRACAQKMAATSTVTARTQV